MKRAPTPAATRAQRPGTAARGAALAAAFALSFMALPARASDGHDHGAAAAAPSANGPQRGPDGSVFVPKPAQRQLGVRTMRTVAATLPRTVELGATVQMDPNAGGQVQALLAGRLAAGPRGLPAIGQAVRRGEVLAYVTASVAPLERAGQTAQLAELRAARVLADKRVARLKELADTVPRKEIEAAESEAASLGARAAAVGAGLAAREALVAPASGVIASAHAVAGQVVEARELLFEIVDPARLRIEALAFDAALASNIGSATLALGGDAGGTSGGGASVGGAAPATQRVPLVFVGAARRLREQALPLSFRAEGAALSQLAVGQPVRVFVQTKQTVAGLAVPVAALMKNPANQTIVWVKTAPERFEPRTVTTEPLDGVSAAVTSGLQAGDRVATQGATLINQIR